MTTPFDHASQEIIRLMDESEHYSNFHPLKWERLCDMFYVIETSPSVMEHQRLCMSIMNKITYIRDIILQRATLIHYYGIKSITKRLKRRMIAVEHLIHAHHGQMNLQSSLIG